MTSLTVLLFMQHLLAMFSTDGQQIPSSLALSARQRRTSFSVCEISVNDQTDDIIAMDIGTHNLEAKASGWTHAGTDYSRLMTSVQTRRPWRTKHHNRNMAEGKRLYDWFAMPAPFKISPHFTSDKLPVGCGAEPKIDVFEDWMTGWVLRHAHALCAANYNFRQDAGFAILTLVTAYFEPIESYHTGKSSHGKSKLFFSQRISSRVCQFARNPEKQRPC